MRVLKLDRQSIQRDVRKLKSVRMTMKQKSEYDPEIARLHERIAQMEARIQAAIDRERALQQQLAMLYSSTSWRISAPLRFVKRHLVHFLTNHLPPASAALLDSRTCIPDQLDLNAEPANVRHLYLRLVRTRERISGRG
jgi:hypothetical protein